MGTDLLLELYRKGKGGFEEVKGGPDAIARSYSFFMVSRMWSSSDEVLKRVGAYFRERGYSEEGAAVLDRPMDCEKEEPEKYAVEGGKAHGYVMHLLEALDALRDEFGGYYWVRTWTGSLTNGVFVKRGGKAYSISTGYGKCTITEIDKGFRLKEGAARKLPPGRVEIDAIHGYGGEWDGSVKRVDIVEEDIYTYHLRLLGENGFLSALKYAKKEGLYVVPVLWY